MLLGPAGFDIVQYESRFFDRGRVPLDPPGATTMNEHAIDPILAPEYRRSPHEVIARLRREDPVHYIAPMEAWAICRYDLVKALFDHPSVIADRRYWDKYVSPPTEFRRWMYEHIPKEEYYERHALERRMVAGGLSAAAVKRMEGLIREIVERYAAPLRGRRGVVDLAAAFTEPVPSSIMSRITGIAANEGEEAQFLQMTRDALGEMNPTESPEQARRMEQAFEDLCRHVRECADRRRAEPREDLISHLLQTRGLTDEDANDLIVLWISNLVRAGTPTVSLATKYGVRILLRHPEVLQRLRRDRSLVPKAVNEILRYDFGDGMLPKYAKEDFEIEGKKIQKGQLILLSFLGAHRDPEAFPDPERFDIERDTSREIIFGYGHSSCLGAHLARKELQIIFDALLDVLPEGARVLEDRIQWSPLGPFSHMDTLPIDFGN